MSTKPSIEPAPRITTLGFALAALLIQLPTYNRSIVPMDEGHLAAVASWLQHGKYLYQDLHSGIFPGIYHLTALLFQVLGNDLVVARWAQVATNIAITLCLWLAGTRTMRRSAAAVAPLLYLAVIPVSFPVLVMFNYSSLALAFSMASLLYTIRLLDENRRSDAIALGALLALAVISKQNFGALAFVACSIAIAWNRRGAAIEDATWTSVLAPVALSGIAVTSIFVVYFLITGTWMDFLNSTVIQLGGDQMQSFHNPIPPILGPHPLEDSRFIFLYTPPILFNEMIHGETVLGLPVDAAMQSLAIRLSFGIPVAALLAGVALLGSSQRLLDTRKKRGIRVVVVFASLFFLGIFPSSVWSHLAFVLPPILLLIGLLIDNLDGYLARIVPGSRWFLRGSLAALVVVATVAGLMASSDIARWNSTPLGLERGSLYVAESQAEIYRSAAAFIESCAPEGEPIFVAPHMPVVYFLTDRLNATRYDLTIPGDVEGDLIVAGLHTSKTRCVIYNPVMYPEFPPFEELFPEVKRYLARNYRVTHRIRGGNEIWLGMMRNRAVPGNDEPTPVESDRK